MPTDEERREVAEDLRYEVDYPCRPIQYMEQFVGDLRQIIFSDFTTDADYSEMFSRLADLIDPEPERTCRPHVWCDGLEECHGVNERWIAECESCGAMLGESFSEERTRSMLPNYCPCCGARIEVVDDANQRG